MIRAAGGLVFRVTPKGRIKVLVVHRPRYDDWGLPKGKHDPGESDEEAALREVREETGYACRIVAPLGESRHRTGSGTKEVAWFAMRPLPAGPGFEPNDEIDRIRWLSPRRAARAVDYDNDRRLIESTRYGKLASTGTIWIVRHGVAVDKSGWDGDDRARPLDRRGKRQASRLSKRLHRAGIERIVSSPAKRCLATVRPLAKATGAKVERDERLARDATAAEVAALLDSLVGYNVVICTHGETIPHLLEVIAARGGTVDSRAETAKGSMWRIDVRRGKFGRARYSNPV